MTLFERAAAGERTERTPVWLMRQAGRSDPEYCRLREAWKLPLEDLFRHPGYATRLSLLPRRFGVDAIIFYQDILTPLSPMGAHFVFAPGPQLAQPMDTVDALDRLTTFVVEEHMPFVGETLGGIREEIAGDIPVLGFAGAPLTLLVFLIEGGSFGASAPKALEFLRGNPAAAHRALEKLTAMTIDYLKYQAGCGVAAVQLFESAAYLLDEAQYREFALPYQQRIFAALRGTVKTIQFARDMNDVELLAAAGADILSLPTGISIAQARAALGPEVVLQGNLDNKLMLGEGFDPIEAAARRILREGDHNGHIFNLSHGLLKETPFENVTRLVELVREYRSMNVG
jgi:uroporphyrinogen decarboxylase